MEAKRDSRAIYEFAEFRLDTGELMLYRDDEQITLPPKAIETLQALIERSGQIVSKDDLMQAIWSDAVVEESNLSRYIHMLRSTLGSKPDGTPFIETFRRRGYRFRGDVSRRFEGRQESATSVPVAGRESRGTLSSRGRVVALAEWTRPAAEEPQRDALRVIEPAAIEAPAPASRRWKMSAVIVPLLLVIIGSGAWFSGLVAFRSSSPPLTDKDVILVADFDNRTGEEVFDKTLKQGLAIQLQQSPFLSLFPDDRVRETLKLMKRPMDTRITREVAREICLRHGLKAYMVGSIAPLGTRYGITVETVNAASGEMFASELIEAATKEEILHALTTLSLRLREKLGESLASIEKLATPLEATTSSLDALRLYTQGRLEVQETNNERAAMLFEQATKLDPEFAIAFMELASTYALIGRRELIPPVIMRAYELRDTVSQRERLSIIDAYHSFITARNDLRLENQELLRELYPRESTVYIGICNLAWFLGQYDRAIGECRTAVDLGEKQAYTSFLRSMLGAGQFEKAAQTVEEAENSGVERPRVRALAITIAFVRGKYEEVDRRIEELSREPNPSYALQVKGNIAAYKGRAKEAEAHFREAIKAAEESSEGAERRAALYADDARFKAILGSCAEASTSAKAAYSIAPMALTRGPLAWTLAICGERKAAMDIVGAMLQQYPEGSIQTKSMAPTARALVALEQGDASAAIEHLKIVPRGFESRSFFWIQNARGQAFLKLHRGTDAAAEFQKIIDRRGEDALSPLYPLAHLGLARARAQAGDIEGSREAYERFLDLWKDADPDLAPLIEAKREYQDMLARR